MHGGDRGPDPSPSCPSNVRILRPACAWCVSPPILALSVVVGVLPGRAWLHYALPCAVAPLQCCSRVVWPCFAPAPLPRVVASSRARFGASESYLLGVLVLRRLSSWPPARALVALCCSGESMGPLRLCGCSPVQLPCRARGWRSVHSSLNAPSRVECDRMGFVFCARSRPRCAGLVQATALGDPPCMHAFHAV